MIFDFGKLAQRINAGKYQIRALEYAHAQRKDIIMDEVAEAFYKILMINNKISQQEKDVATNKSLLNQTEAFFNAGRV